MKMRPRRAGWVPALWQGVDGRRSDGGSFAVGPGSGGTVTVRRGRTRAGGDSCRGVGVRRTRALPRWKRKEILEDIAASFIEQKERFAQLIVAEAGSRAHGAGGGGAGVLVFKTAAEEAVRLSGESIPLDLTEGNEGRWGLVQRFPVGPVLAITPFNFPLMLVAHKVAPAIAAGCPMLVKPAPQTPFTALALGEVVLKAGWPEEALSVLPLSNEDTGWLAEREDRLKLVSFTGSAAVGWQLKSRSGRKRVTLELGGNAAMIVHSDWKDLDAVAMRTAHGAFGYAGQSCISVQRVYVERRCYQTFLWKVVERARRWCVGIRWRRRSRLVR